MSEGISHFAGTASLSEYAIKARNTVVVASVTEAAASAIPVFSNLW